jgi:hypothetical protein
MTEKCQKQTRASLHRFFQEALWAQIDKLTLPCSCRRLDAPYSQRCDTCSQ